MIAFHIFGRPIYRYGIMYLISFLAGYVFLSHITKKQYIKKVSPTLQTILDGRVDDLLTYIIVGGILGGRLGEVFIYERSYYSHHLDQILATRNGGMSFIGGIIGALIAVSIFLWIHRPKKQLATRNSQLATFLTLTDLMAAIAPLGIMLGRIGNWLNRELYGPVVVNLDLISSQAPTSGFDRSRPLQWLTSDSLGIQGRLYSIIKKLGLLYDYGTTQFHPGELRLNTNFLASAGEGLLILIILQIIFWTHRKNGKSRPGFISGLFLILYSVVRFVLEYVRMDSLDDYIRGLTSTQWLSVGMMVVGILMIFRHKRCPLCRGSHQEPHRSYDQEANNGPKNRHNICNEFSACGGKSQSPINIETANITSYTSSPIKASYTPSLTIINNNGHTIQHTIINGRNHITIDGKTYALMQFHYHTQSEHTINRKHYPLELHLVHHNTDNTYAVIAVMFSLGNENPTLNEYLNTLPGNTYDPQIQKMIKIHKLLPKNMDYYHYKGSLTTPPCTESVSRYILTTPVELSQKQLNTFANILHNNYRPTQPINERTITTYNHGATISQN